MWEPITSLFNLMAKEGFPNFMNYQIIQMIFYYGEEAP